MPELHQKLYAYLVGEVDGALQMIAKGYAEQADKERLLLTVGEKLKAALLAAEDMYIEQEDGYAGDRL